MKSQKIFKTLPKNFRREEEALISRGLDSMESVKEISDDEIINLVKSRYCTERNLRRLRCIALLVCELNLSQREAALLMHSGISSIEALKKSTPQEVINKTGRLERNLKPGTDTVVNLEKANKWINQAKEWDKLK